MIEESYVCFDTAKMLKEVVFINNGLKLDSTKIGNNPGTPGLHDEFKIRHFTLFAGRALKKGKIWK